MFVYSINDITRNLH